MDCDYTQWVSFNLTVKQEDGVGTAIQAIYRDLEYAKSLIKHRTVNPDCDVGDEESWTFIGDESDPELARRIAEWDPMARLGEGARKKSVAAATEERTGPLGIKFLQRGSKDAVPTT